MTGLVLGGLVRRLRRLADEPEVRNRADEELLGHFVAQGDETAFAELMRRHGPMVLAVCRRVLAGDHDAEDAFQAVFLVLFRKARSIKQRERLANWLYGVSLRTAQKARALLIRRRARQKHIEEQKAMATMHTAEEPAWYDLRPVVDEELGRLPEKYRLPVVLCDLEGRSRSVVARQLGWPEGTLSSRLARARQILAKRLAARGLAVSSAALVAGLTRDTLAASIPPGLEVATLQALAGAAAPRVADLAHAVIQAMWLTHLKGTVMKSLTLAFLGICVLTTMGAFFTESAAEQPAQAKFAPEKPAELPVAKKPRACIVIWLSGGPSQFDTFDPKPGNANGGPFKAIDTTVPGIQVSEHLPKLAKQMKDLALIRSMTHREGDHSRADYLMRTGHAKDASINFPTFGAVLAKELEREKPELPSYVCLTPAPFTLAACFRDARHAPLVLQGSPPMLPSLEAFEALDRARAEPMRTALKDALNLDAEKAKVRDGYGRNPFGEGCLLARRMVQRGTTVVEVTLGGWDTHANAEPALGQASALLDTGLSALLADLKDHGLLDTTLVVCTGEFGRTPRINVQGGRDHWSLCFTTVLAGARIKGGQALGKTNADGGIDERPVTVPELHATIYRALGVDLTRRYKIDGDTEVPLVEKGTQPVKELLPAPSGAAVPTRKIKELIGMLESADFATRQRADTELEALGEAALPALREALAARPDLDVRRRLERIVERIEVTLWRGTGIAVRKRLERILRLNPKLGDAELVRSVYLLTVARAPSEDETTAAVGRLKESKDRREAVMGLARALVQGREFNEDMSIASGKLLEWQARLHDQTGAAVAQIVLLNQGKDVMRDVSGKVAKPAAALNNPHLFEMTFLLTLSRLPKEAEVKSLDRHFGKGTDRRQAIDDLIWALVNCNEFVLDVEAVAKP
jgi:RNA polymerase sigma factor (sigma-70 family)